MTLLCHGPMAAPVAMAAASSDAMQTLCDPEAHRARVRVRVRVRVKARVEVRVRARVRAKVRVRALALT